PKATQPKSVTQNPKSKKASEAPTPPRRSSRIVYKLQPEVDVNLEDELLNVHSDAELETPLPPSVVDEVILTPLPPSGNSTPLPEGVVSPQGSRSAEKILELLKNVPNTAQKLGVDESMVDEDDIDLGSNVDVDERLGYDPGDNFGPCVKLREDYVSNEKIMMRDLMMKMRSLCLLQSLSMSLRMIVTLRRWGA
ncbi:hypothetical protein FRX31_017398, partial [Thalictrum thalictroides]